MSWFKISVMIIAKVYGHFNLILFKNEVILTFDCLIQNLCDEFVLKRNISRRHLYHSVPKIEFSRVLHFCTMKIELPFFTIAYWFSFLKKIVISCAFFCM